MNSSNIEQQTQESTHRIGRPKRISSIFNDSEEDLTSAGAFSKLHRHTSIGRESDSEEPRFHSMHRLRYRTNLNFINVTNFLNFSYFAGVHVLQNDQRFSHRIQMNQTLAMRTMMMMASNYLRQKIFSQPSCHVFVP